MPQKNIKTDALLEFGKIILPHQLYPDLPDHILQPIKTIPFAFAFAATLDHGTRSEDIWSMPYYIQLRQGKQINPEYFASSSEKDIKNLFASLPKKPRYINAAPRTAKELSNMIISEFGGETEQIWNKRSLKDIKKAFESIYGVGPGISSMITIMVEKCYGIIFSPEEHRQMDIKPDRNVRRVFYRLGLIDENSKAEAIHAARHLNPEFPGALHGPSWVIGKEWCHPKGPKCQDCPLRIGCNKLMRRSINC